MPYFVLIRERSSGWNWSVPLRRQPEWEAHAAFMDALETEGFILAGGPLGDEDDAARVMHIVSARDGKRSILAWQRIRGRRCTC